jgi:RimJ/RimL family protein N-acetyltransferase
MKYIRQPDASIEQTQKRMLEMINYNKKNPDFGLFVAFEKESNECIGWAILIHAELNESKQMEIGYRLFSKFWAKGLATELSKRMLEYAKEQGLKKVCGVTRPDNLASRKVLEKSGLNFIDEREFYNQNCSYYEVEYE